MVIILVFSEFLNRKAEEIVEKDNESVSEPESPVPGLPPRLHGKGVSWKRIRNHRRHTRLVSFESRARAMTDPLETSSFDGKKRFLSMPFFPENQEVQNGEDFLAFQRSQTSN